MQTLDQFILKCGFDMAIDVEKTYRLISLINHTVAKKSRTIWEQKRFPSDALFSFNILIRKCSYCYNKLRCDKWYA